MQSHSKIRFIVHPSCFVSVFCFGFVLVFFHQNSNGMEKCLLCSGLKQQNTAVAQPVYVHVRFHLALLISSVSLLLSKYKFSNVHTDLVLLHFFLLVWGWLWVFCLFVFLCLSCLSHLASIRDIAAIFLLWKSKLLEPHPYLLLSGLWNSQATQLTCNASTPSSGFFLAKHSQPPPVSEVSMTQIWRIGKPEAEFPRWCLLCIIRSSLQGPFPSSPSLSWDALVFLRFSIQLHKLGPVSASLSVLTDP